MVAAEHEIQSTGWRTQTGVHKPFILNAVERKFLFIALGALFAVRLLTVFWFPFVDPTEARYAEIARKMVETGDWITPQFDYGIPFWGKPPLHTWLSALGMKIFGIGHFGARVFILVTALGTLGLVFAWIRQHKGRDQALVATMVLASSFMFFGAAAFVMTDMVMVLGTTLSMVAFYNCLCGGPSSVVWGRLFFVGIAVGLLAKGPVTLAIVTISILPWLILSANWRKMHGFPWKSGLLIAAVLTLPWYIAAEVKTPGFLRYFIVGEHFERFVVPGWQGDLYGSGHEEPKGIIWLYGLATFLPWTLFALPLIACAKTLVYDMPREERAWHSYLAFWAVSPLVLFTPAANVLPAYALPGLPAAAPLLISLWAHAYGATAWKTRAAAITAVGAVAGIFLTLSMLAWVFPDVLGHSNARDLVATARKIDPEVRFTYWGCRSYSAEFYTHGGVRFTDQPATLDTLSANSLRDAVAIPLSAVAKVAPFLGGGFDQIGEFGEHVLFIERTAS